MQLPQPSGIHEMEVPGRIALLQRLLRTRPGSQASGEVVCVALLFFAVLRWLVRAVLVWDLEHSRSQADLTLQTSMDSS